MLKSRLLSASALVGSLLIVMPAFAQTTTTPAPSKTSTTDPSEDTSVTDTNADGSAETGPTVVVTGSRIPRPSFDGTIPGVQVTSQQIEARSFTNTLDVLNDIPLVGPGASPFGTNGGQPASLGAAFVDLLDLGTNRTLTLVNGRRYVSGNAATLFVQGNTTGAQVDLNTIPTALLDRLDILTVGGAVAYGSDAIAGVVNAILKTDFEGLRLSALGGVTQRGDGGNYRLTGVYGVNFAGGRGNVSVSGEYVRDDALYGDSRRGINANYVAPTSFKNGGVRNTGFAPAFDLNVAGGAGAFLPSASDLVPNNIAGIGYPGGTGLYSPAGVVFQINGNIGGGFFGPNLQGIATVSPQDPVNAPNFRPAVLYTQAGNTNLVPGMPIATGNGCVVTNLTNFCNFAPLALPTGTAAQQATFVNAVLGRYAPTFVGQGTQAQRNALALQLLQANTQTPREYLARNPNTDINAFVGTFIANYLDVANPNAANNGVLPRIAVPLQFDNAGNIINPTLAVIADPANTPSTTGGLVGGNAAFNPARYTNLRVQQDRYIANLLGHFDLTDWATVYTENQYAHVKNVSPRNFASRNSVDVGSSENATLVMQLSNPYLTAAARTQLAAAGVTNQFILSRTNQDIVGENPATVTSDTYRTVAGVRGKFGALGRDLRYDLSFTYGRSDAKGKSYQIKDIEYALAVDAVDQGLVTNGVANGNIVCRAQTNPSAYIGTTPVGVVGLETIRTKNAQGQYVEQRLRRTITADQIAACRPLNVFGYNQMSADSKAYTLAQIGFKNKSQQYFAQGSLAGSFFDLPAGPLGFAVSGEYRRDELSYRPDDLSRIGGTRTAALAATEGYIEAWEFGGELRVPLLGDNFHIPLIRNLDFTPGVRLVKQDGRAPDVLLLNGQTLNQKSNGKYNTIYTLGGEWRPIRDLTFRGNYTRSIRQPSVVELFLGGQPSFTTPVDPCSSANIGAGTVPATRRANCIAAVRAAGLATDDASAAAFLNSYVPSGTSVTGSFAGSPGLAPEKGRSYTFGGVLRPRFLSRLQLSADYIHVRVNDQIIPTSVAQAQQLCYDSPTFPDTSAQVGVNTCSFFSRIAAGQNRQFETDNGFNSGFINLGGLQVEGINMTGQYDFPLDWAFGSNAGRFSLYSNAYHLVHYKQAPDGNFGSASTYDQRGLFTRPRWETQLRGRYENGGFFAQWVWNWQSKTKVFDASSIAPVPGTENANEVQDFLKLQSFSLNDASIGYSIGADRRFGIQFTVRNVFDKQVVTPDVKAYAFASYRIDDFGRRYAVTANMRF